ncbi:GNAT family N-acetyltransferase [Pontibacter liquoris]|uniref:GNAT family N-acetyltransferase n=1 Tax=Pontibacter liquoris TaxID=2905677 RepID=UPI001FA6DED5|nr:GNAT family protein [Pontibacter liquoris]
MSFLYNTQADKVAEQLETPHLLLRPYEEKDAGDFMRLLQENPTALSPAFGGRRARVHALEDARLQVQQLRSDWDTRRTFDFGVWLKESERYIGDVALKNLDRSIPKAELGLYFSDWPNTHDLAQEALHAVMEFAFDQLGMNKVYLRCTNSNNFYGELAQTCGFAKEGLLRSDYRGADSDELLDLCYYGITRKDFEKTQQKSSASSEALA